MKFPMPEPLFDRLAARLPQTPAWGWASLAGMALLAGTGVIAWQHPGMGCGLLLVGFLADGVGQAMARRTAAAVLPLVLPGLLLAPFGFALAQPERALAAMFLLFALGTLGWAAGQRVRLIHWLIAAGILVACLLPDRFSFLAYLLGIACFVKAGQVMAARS